MRLWPRRPRAAGLPYGSDVLVFQPGPETEAFLRELDRRAVEATQPARALDDRELT